MRPSPVHSQSKCERAQNSSQGCYFENIVSREVFEKRKFFILWICLRVRMDSRNRSFSRMELRAMTPMVCGGCSILTV
jgi:hypothetical protein